MKSIISFIISISFALLFLVGCSSTPRPDLTKGGQYGERSMFATGKINLPQNFNIKNNRKLLLGVKVGKVVTINHAGLAMETEKMADLLNIRLLTEMKKLNRFSIYAAFNNESTTFYRQLEEIGDVDMPSDSAPPQIDLALTLSITLTAEKHERARDNLLKFIATADVNCVDLHTKTSLFTSKAEGIAYRKEILSLTGRRMGGYSQEDLTQAFLDATLKAMAKIANRLGNNYPVGGEITDIIDNMMSLDRGYEHGIGKDMQMCVFALQGTLRVPIAIAEASPGDIVSTLDVWRWNDTPAARRFIKIIQEDPNWKSKVKLYACSLRMSIPPEWERDDERQ